MKTYEAIITITIVVEADDIDDAYEQAETRFREDVFPDYDIDISEISE